MIARPQDRLPWAIVPAALLCVIASAGAIRAAAGTSPVVSFALSCIGCAWPLAYVARRLHRPDRHELVAIIAGVLSGALAVALLYNRALDGSGAFSGTPDAGHHANFFREFSSNPSVYAGCVSLYAVVALFDGLPHAGVYWGFTVAFYLAVFCIFTVTVEVSLRLAGRASLIAAPLIAAAGYGVVLVFLHYFHAEGFYPQIFGLLPLLLLWGIDAHFSPSRTKLAALGAAFALYRYTYALNLADLAVAAGIALLVTPGWWKTWPRRIATVAAVLVLGAVALRVVRAIAPYYLNWGPFIPYDVRALVVAETVLGGALLLAQRDPVLRGWCRLPAIFALLNAGFLTFTKRPAEHLDYYYLKTSFQPFLLVVLASIGWVLHAPSRARVAVFLVAIAAGTYATRMWRDTFDERVWGHPPFARMKPLVDLRAQRRIDDMLQARHARFGGYLSSYYPLMNFMNAAMSYWNGGIDFYWGRPPDTSPGHCVFWEGGPPKEHLEDSFPQTYRLLLLQKDPASTCTSYAPRWDPTGRRTLCSRCW